MISFAAPIWLALLALALPLIAFHAWRRKTLAVPSVILWRQVAGQHRSRPRFALPRINWPLALQLLGLLLLALAMAQPYWGARAQDQSVYLVDVSGPMQARALTGETRLDAAREIVATAMQDDLLAGTDVTIIAVGATPVPLATSQSRLSGLAPLLDLLSADDTLADWPAAFALAENLMPAAGEVSWHLVTPDAPAMPQTRAEIRHHSPAIALPPALGLSGNAAPELPSELRPRPEGGALIRLSGRVTASAADAQMPENLPLRFYPYDEPGVVRDFGSLGLAPTDDPLVMRFSSVQSLPKPGMLMLSLPDDATPHDNLLVFDSLMPWPAKVLLLQPAVAEGEDDPLLRALGAAFGAADQAESLPDAAAQAGYDLIVVNNLTLPRRPLGNVLWLDGGGLSGEDFADPVTAPLTSWSHDHPASATLPLAQLGALTYRAMPALDGAHILATAGEQPVISARRQVQGVEMRASLDPVASGWTEGDMLLRLLLGFADWAGIGPQARIACEIGTACVLPAHLALADITAPDGSLHPASDLPPSTLIPESMARFSGPKLGLYHLADGRPLVVRRAETALTTPPATTETAPQAPALALAPWLALVAMIVLLLEAWRAWRNGYRGALPFALRGLAVIALGAAYVGLALPRISNDAVIRRIDTSQAGPLGEQILLALSQIPADAPAQLHLQGQGFDRHDDAARALPLLQARATALDLVITPEATAQAVEIYGMDLPQQARVGDLLPVTLQLWNAQDAPITLPLTIAANGVQVVESAHVLAPGLNRIDTAVTATEEGLLRLAIAFGADGPATRAVLPVAAAPKALIIARNTQWGAYLGEALALQGMEVEVLLPVRAPLLADRWLERDLIILADVPATALSYEKMQQIEGAVRDHGRALMILGGPNAFGPGGYFATPLEALSPLSANVPQEAPLASVAFVVDRSGSMLAGTGAGSRLDVARAATISAANTLDPQSWLSVVAFDATAHLMLPLTQGANAQMLETALREVTPGGGTAVLPALDMAISVLGASDLPLRHIVVMTDGQVENYPFDATIARAQAAGITISAIGIGAQARTTTLIELAEQGGGAFHSAQDIRSLPSILAQEAMSLAGDPVERGQFMPYWRDRASDPIFTGLPDVLPPLDAYIKTTLRDGADLQIALSDDGNEVPLMASWYQGAGQVMAFATQAAGGGSEAWMRDPAYPRFWAQIGRQMVAESAPMGLSIATTRVKDRLILDLTRILAIDPTLREDPSGIARLTLTAPDATTRNVIMSRNGEFTWQGEAALDQPGHWQISARHGQREAHADLYIADLAQPRDPAGDAFAFAGFVQATGGEIREQAADAAAARWNWHLNPARSPWLALALLLLMADLAARYLRRSKPRPRP